MLINLAEQGNAQVIAQGNWSKEQLDARGNDGRTALMIAAMRGDYMVARALRGCGADLHLADGDGRKAVDLAALYGHANVIAELIEGGCGG